MITWNQPNLHVLCIHDSYDKHKLVVQTKYELANLVSTIWRSEVNVDLTTVSRATSCMKLQMWFYHNEHLLWSWTLFLSKNHIILYYPPPPPPTPVALCISFTFVYINYTVALWRINNTVITTDCQVRTDWWWKLYFSNK